MPEKKVNQPTEEVQENPESKIKRLEEQLQEVQRVAEQAISENQILRATVKALSQLI